MKIRDFVIFTLIALNAWVLLYIIDLSSVNFRDYYPGLYVFLNFLSISALSTMIILGALIFLNQKSLRSCMVMSLYLLGIFWGLDIVFRGLIGEGVPAAHWEKLPGYLYIGLLCPFTGFGLLRIIRKIRI